MPDTGHLTEEEQQQAAVIRERLAGAINEVAADLGVTNTGPVLAGLAMVMGNVVMSLFPPERHIPVMEDVCATMTFAMRNAHQNSNGALN